MTKNCYFETYEAGADRPVSWGVLPWPTIRERILAAREASTGKTFRVLAPSDASQNDLLELAELGAVPF